MKKIFFIILVLFLFSSSIVFAAGVQSPANPPPSTANPGLTDPLGLESEGANAPQILIGRIINAALGIVGSLALAMFIYGGFTWMLAAGSSDKIQKGKNIIIWAIVGLIVIFSAYAMVKFVLSAILGV